MAISMFGSTCLAVHVAGIHRIVGPTASSLSFPAFAAAAGKRSCSCIDMHNELVPYVDAMARQRSIVELRRSLTEKDEDSSDTILVLQHHPVYTLGSGSTREFLKFDECNSPYEVHRAERGGEVTYHGPGQLIMYPILNLRYHEMDLRWYLWSLEEVIIRALSSTWSINASRKEGLTGVWVGDKKIAAIGVRARRWITFNGLAVNITTDLTPFQHIIPCGIREFGVCRLKDLLGMSEERKLEDAQLLDRTYQSLITEFCEVFQLSLA